MPQADDRAGSGNETNGSSAEERATGSPDDQVASGAQNLPATETSTAHQVGESTAITPAGPAEPAGSTPRDQEVSDINRTSGTPPNEQLRDEATVGDLSASKPSATPDDGRKGDSLRAVAQSLKRSEEGGGTTNSTNQSGAARGTTGETEKVGEPLQTLRPWCFDNVLLIPEDDPDGIDIRTHKPRATPTPEMLDFLHDVFAVERVIRVLFSDKKHRAARTRFLKELSASAESGLCGKDFDVATGRLNLDLTKDEIAEAFPMLRDELWKSYFYILLLFLALLGPLGGITYYQLIIKDVFATHNEAVLKVVPSLRQTCVALAWIPLGVPLGMFLEFVFRVNEKTTYDGLLAINPGRWKPWRRTATTVTTAYVFAFIIGINAIQIGIGNVLLNDFLTTKPWLSLALGFITGFAFPYVRDVVTGFRPEPKEPSTLANAKPTPAGGEQIGKPAASL